MTAFFKVLSNIKHSGENLTTGTVFEGPMKEFEQLVEAGALKVIEGAKDLAHAIELAAKETEAALDEAEKEIESSEAANTWGPKKDEEIQAPDLTGQTSEPVKTEKEVVAPGQVGTGDLPPEKTGDNL